MKSNTTTLWLVLAAVLAAAVWFVEKHFQPAAQPDNALLAGLQAADVTSIQVIPPGGREISVIRTNGSWYLERPVAYPARGIAIESLLSTLEKLTPSLRLTAAESATHKNADAEYGFENPQYTLDVTAGEQSWHLKIGSKTAPGDGVYVRLVGGAGLYVTDVDWLQSLPHDVAAWRDTSLVADVSAIDWLVITNGAKAIELRRDPTNRLWRMVRPLQAARADSAYITTALQQLHTATTTHFVTDDPKADLASFGLQPAELDVWLGQGTNLIDGIHAGKDSTENPGQIFARRDGWNSVVTTAKEAIAPWRGDVNDFRDPHLLDITGSVAEIEVRGVNNFTLQRQGSNQWAVAGEKFPVDMQNLQLFARMLASLRITEFRKDVVTGPDLQGFGLAPTNSLSITLRAIAGDTNAVIAGIIFGATETNKVFVKRADEPFVYVLALPDVQQLPRAGWQFRDRHIWSFSPTNVAQVTLHRAGKTQQFIHNGFQKWSVAPGSQGIIPDTVGLEESVNQFGSLATDFWLNRNFTPEQYGFTTNSPQITFELTSGEKLSLDLGQEIPSATTPTACAAVTLDGDRWAFILSPAIYQLVDLYLKIPAGAP